LKKIITRTLIWIDRWHWLWLLLAAPFLLFPNPRRSLAMLVIPGLWLLGWIVGRFREREPGEAAHPGGIQVTPLNSMILLLSLMVLVSTWATYDIGLSLPKISGMILGFGVFYGVVREGSHPRRWGLILALYLFIGLGVSGLGLIGTNWFTSKLGSLFDSAIGKIPTLISGLPGAEAGFHPNEIAGALTWVLPLMLALSLYFVFLPRNNYKRLSLRGAPEGRRSNLPQSQDRNFRS
jgi:hypothetical protein